MNLKGLLAGVALIILIGIAGFLYRSVKEQAAGPLACQADARLCPDGTALGRTGPNCTFPACPFPNVDHPAAGIAYSLPPGYASTTPPDADTVAAYVKKDPSGLESYIYIRRYTYADMTASDFIHSNAIMDASGMPASPSAFSSVALGPSPGRLFSVVNLGRFEGVVMTTYYLSRENKKEVVRFDAQSRNVLNWTDPALDISKLPANQDLRALLATLQGN